MNYFAFLVFSVLTYFSEAQVKVLYYRRITNDYFPEYTDFAAPSEFWPDSCWITNFRWDPNCATDLKYFTGWSNSLNQIFAFQMCGAYKILGGYNQMASGYTLQRTFSNLPAHSQMEVTFDFLRIDTWDNENLFVSIDDIVIFTGTYTFNSGSQLCGIQWVSDQSIPISGKLGHTSSLATIKIWTSLDQSANDESFGVKNFAVYLYISCSIGCLTCSSPNYCTSCPTHSKLVNGVCICKDNYYMEIKTWVHCSLCYLACKKCSSKEKNACTECYEGYELSSGSCILKSNVNQIVYELINHPPSNADSWTYSGCSLAYQTECGEFTIVGGYNNFGLNCKMSKSFVLPLPHYQLAYHFNFFKIDAWDDEHLLVEVDSVEKTKISYSKSFDTEYDRNFCGTSHNDHVEDVFQIVSYSYISSTPKITISTTLNEDASNESWGINNFHMYYFLCHSTCKTCKGAALTDCQSCYDFANIISSGECKCNDGYFMRIPNELCTKYPCSSCDSCDSTCKTCETTSACKSCNPPLIFYDEKCIAFCPEHYFKEFQSNTCLRQCSSPNCGVNATRTCEKECPVGSFLHIETNICWPCDTKCTKCFGLSANECTACVENFFIQKSTCVDFCSINYFFNETSKTCEKCLDKCSKCTNTKTCEVCENSYLLMNPNNDSCEICNKTNNYKQGIYCFECVLNCKLCESNEKCQICMEGFYINAEKCLIQKLIKAELYYDNVNPFRIHLKFNAYWKNGFDALPSKLQLKTLNLNPDLYTYNFNQNDIDQKDFFLDFTFKSNITAEMKLNLKFDLPINDEYKMAISEYDLPLKEFIQCSDGNIYNNTSKSCKQTILVTPILKYGRNFDELTLSLDPEFESLFKVIANNTVISIGNLNFTYSFIPNDKSYIIKFKFNQTFTNKPICKLFISTPSEILYNSSNIFSLKLNEIMIAMQSYYIIDDSVKRTIENTQKTTEQVNSISFAASLSYSILSMGSSTAISIMMSLEIIRFLKYLEIDYPPNVEEMFKSIQRGSGFIPDFFWDVDEAEKATLPFRFTKFSNSIYPFNNSGNLLIENIFFWGLGFLVLIARKGFRNRISSSEAFRKIFEFLIYIFVWNFSITYFLGVYLNYIFFSLLSFKFPPLANLSGHFNLVYSVLLLIVLVFLIFFFWKQTRSYYSNRKRKNFSNVSKSKIFDYSDYDLSKENNNYNSSISDSKRSLKIINLEESPQKENNVHFHGDNLRKDIHPNKNQRISKEVNRSETILKKFWKRNSTALNRLVDTIGIPASKLLNKVFKKKTGTSSSSTSPSPFNLKEFEPPTSKTLKERKRFNCLKKGLKNYNKGQYFFLFFDLIRQTLIAFMIVFFFNNPIIALIIINFGNFNFLMLIIFIKPQKNKLDLIQAIINELCVNFACFACMALIIMEKTGNNDAKQRIDVGWIIVFANIIFMIVFLGRLILIITYCITRIIAQLIERCIENKKKSTKVEQLAIPNIKLDSKIEKIQKKRKKEEI